MPLDLSKPIQTRDGRKARVLCTDYKLNERTLVVAITQKDKKSEYESIGFLYPNGTHPNYPENCWLINVPEKRTLYCVVLQNNTGSKPISIISAEKEFSDKYLSALYPYFIVLEKFTHEVTLP